MEALMGDNSWWKGKVKNKSKQPIWVIFDKDKVMQAKKLGPNKRTPDDIDADGVQGVLGFKISGWEKPWKLKNGAEAEVFQIITHGFSNENILGIRQTSMIGSLMKVEDSEFGQIKFDDTDNNWGVKL